MRTLWNAITFLAVVNLLALLLVAGWMWQSGRLTAERVAAIGEMLSTTAGQQSQQEAVRRANRQTDAEQAKQREDSARRSAGTDATTQISQIALVHQQNSDARRRQEAERQMLTSQLQQATAELETRANALKIAQAEFDGRLAAEARRRTDDQFLRAVEQLEQLPPRHVKRMLQALAAEGKVDQAVEYLEAMNSRAAAKVLREFKADSEIDMAMELLEALRTRGMGQNIAASDPSPSGR